MNKINHITQLSGHINGFSGRDYQHSIKLAEEFAERNNAEIVNYFEQEHCHKSILVGYNKKNDETEP